MKIFYTTSGDKAKKKGEIYRKTLEILESNISKKNLLSPESRKQIKVTEDRDSRIAAIKEKHLKEADLVIADITNGTAGVGYYISNALFLKKPTLVIQEESDSMNEIQDSITSGKNKYLTYKTYTKDTLEKILLNFLTEAKKKMDTKFILIIPPKIDRYLEWASKHKRMHKAQIVREALEKMIKRDKDWKQAKNQAIA